MSIPAAAVRSVSGGGPAWPARRCRGDDDAVPDDDLQSRPAGRSAGGGDGPAGRGDDQEGRAARGRRARPGGHPRHLLGREDHRDRRPVHRVQGDHPQLRPGRGAVEGGGDRAGQALLADRRQRRGGDPPGVRAGVARGPRLRAAGGGALMRLMTVPEAHRAVDAVWRLESARIIAGVARLVNDVGLAEELAQDALVAALRQWPESGIPPNPGAWLMATARHQAIDRIRRSERLQRKLDQLGHEARQQQERAIFGGQPDFEAVIEGEGVADDLLRLMFIACHPVLSTEARVALTLKLLGGLTTEEIARAFLSTEPTIAQRIVRAKRTLASRQIPFEVPPEPERAARLASVLEVIYLIFNEGYTATAGDDWIRPELCY